MNENLIKALKLYVQVLMEISRELTVFNLVYVKRLNIHICKIKID